MYVCVYTYVYTYMYKCVCIDLYVCTIYTYSSYMFILNATSQTPQPYMTESANGESACYFGEYVPHPETPNLKPFGEFAPNSETSNPKPFGEYDPNPEAPKS